VTKGEVWRVRLPWGGGHAQAGTRPGVIVQDDQVAASLPTALLVPFTGARAALRLPGTVLVQPTVQNGLSVPSVALVFQLTAVDRRKCLQPLGVLEVTTLDQIFAKLDDLTGR
jgi:mRNA interferase MazF